MPDYRQQVATVREPLQAPTLRGQVGVPLALALAGSLSVALALGWLAAEVGLPPLRVMGLALVLCFPVGMWYFVRQAWRTLWREEIRRGEDLNQDGYVGPPSHPVLVGARQRSLHDEQAAARELYDRRLEWFVRTCHQRLGRGRGIAEKDMTQLHLPDGRKLTLEQYDEYRDLLLRAGYAEWRNPQRHKTGWRLVPGLSAAEIMRQARRPE